jgi:hypothetical protein
MSTINAVGVGLTGASGTGSFAGSVSPSFTTPVLGTPTSGTLTNCTGLPIAGTTGYGTGVATALAAAVTGSGGISLTTSPTFVTPVLGAATATSINFGGTTLSTYAGFTSWTPVFTFATPGNLSVVYTTQSGFYSRIGNIVTAIFYLSITPTYTTSSGKAEITGLPFSSNASSVNDAFGNLFMQAPTFPTLCTSIACRVQAGTSLIDFLASGSAQSAANFTTTNIATATGLVLSGSITYLI